MGTAWKALDTGSSGDTLEYQLDGIAIHRASAKRQAHIVVIRMTLPRN